MSSSVNTSEEMGDVEDDLIDLNKEPVERKRKRVEIEEDDNNKVEADGKGSGDGLAKGGRVMRSRTLAMTDGEKQEIRLEIVEMEGDVDKNEAVEIIGGDQGETKVVVPVLKKVRKLKVGRGGRLQKTKEGECEGGSPSLSSKDRGESEVPVPVKKREVEGRRGRPPKKEGISEVSCRKIGDEAKGENEVRVMEDEGPSKVPVVQKRKKMKGNRGRPPKKEGKSEVSCRKTDNDVKGESDVLVMEDKGLSKVPVVHKMKTMKGRRGRPPKKESISGVSCRKTDDEVKGENEVPVMEDEGPSEVPVVQKSEKKKKGKRGRPRKCEDSLLSSKEKSGKVVGRKKVNESSNGAGLGKERAKPKRGRPPKMQNGDAEEVIKKKMVKRSSDKQKPLLEGRGNKVGVDGVVKRKKVKVERAEGMELGIRERKQLLRDQIVAMLLKAGWTVEHRQRQSKDYQDAVFVDRIGRTYWSVTLAYKKLKEKIDSGKAEEIDIAAFSPIPEETFSMLFRHAEKGKKAGKKKNLAVKTIKRTKKKDSSKNKSGGGKQRTLLARKPRDESDSDGYTLYEGKRSLLSWMIDLGTVPRGGKVKYKRERSKRILLQGRFMEEGICCDCCNITHAIQDFESLADSTSGKPYQNIYLDSGVSLFQCLLDAWKKHMEKDNIGFVHVDLEGDDPNDDTCNVCGDGGDLICCDSCPSTFHNGCLRIKVPSGDWECVYCSCKFCGVACGSTSTSDDEHGLSSELVTCCLCEEKFHLHCVKGTIVDEFDYEKPSFCGNECLKIFQQLQGLFGVRHELQEGFSYSILKHHAISSDASLNGEGSKLESNSKLAVAFTVMDECFEPIIDERSGTNMIHNVVFNCGSNIRRLNYSGFFTITLEKGEELVAAASIRIHGSQLAEMPFIGTRFMYRRQGMCTRLLTATETVLRLLGVEKLVIPAISELNETWTKVFGFVPLEESKRHEMRYMSMIVFPRVDMLQKPLFGHQLDNRQTDSAVVAKCAEVDSITQENPASDSNVSADVKVRDQEKVAAVKSNANLNDASATKSTEVETHSQDAEVVQNNDTGGLTAPDVDISSSEVQIHHNYKVCLVESGSIMPVGSSGDADIKFEEVNVGGSSEGGPHPSNSKDDKRSLKAKNDGDCILEAQRTGEENKTGQNEILSDIGNGKM